MKRKRKSSLLREISKGKKIKPEELNPKLRKEIKGIRENLRRLEEKKERTWRDMRILWYSVAPYVKSGYGVVTKNFVSRLIGKGFTTMVVAYYGLAKGGFLKVGDIVTFPIETRQGDNLGFRSVIQHHKKFQTDIIIYYTDFWVAGPLTRAVKETVAYTVLDHEDYAEEFQDVLRSFYKVAIASKHGVNEARKYGIRASFIPHGVDINSYFPLSKEACKKSLNIDPKTFVLGIVAANNDREPRKGWDKMFEAIKIFLDNNPKVKKEDKFKVFIHTDPLNNQGYNLKLLAKRTGIGKYIIFQDPYLALIGLPDRLMNRIYGSFDVLMNLSRREGFCLEPGTLIQTYSGLKPIEKIRKGELVLTHNGRFRKVLDVLKRYVSEPIIEIKPYCFNSISLTKEHPLFVSKRWKEAGSLEKKDRLFLPKIRQIKTPSEYDLSTFGSFEFSEKDIWCKMGFSPKDGKQVKFPRRIPINKELAELFGWFVAEGGINKKLPLISLTNSSREVLQRINYLMEKLFRRKSKIYRNKDLFFSGKILKEFLIKTCGKPGAENKRIPREILFGPVEILESFLSSYIKGDGHKSERRISISTKSRQLANDLILAFVRLGKRTRIDRDKRKGKEVYVVEASSLPAITHSNKSYPIDSGLEFFVRNKHERSYRGVVYNLEVEEDNSYVTESFTVHNCLPMLEAQACKVPCIATNFSAMIERNNYGKAGWLVKPATTMLSPLGGVTAIPDEHKAAEALEEAYFNKKKRELFAKRSLAYARQQTWDIAIEKYWMPFLKDVGTSLPQFKVKKYKKIAKKIQMVEGYE